MSLAIRLNDYFFLERTIRLEGFNFWSISIDADETTNKSNLM